MWGKNRFFRKVYLPREPTGRYCFFCLFHLQDPKPNRNHQIASWPAVEQEQDQVNFRHVWHIGVISFVLGKIQMWRKVIWKNFTKNVQIWLIFQALYLISPKIYVFLLPPIAWLESYGRHCWFGANISGSLSFS